jgi:TPR repeat protein
MNIRLLRMVLLTAFMAGAMALSAAAPLWAEMSSAERETPSLLDTMPSPGSGAPVSAPPDDDDLLPMPTQRDADGAWSGNETGTEGDLAFGAFQRGLYLTAFLAATERLEADPADAPAMTLIGELYRDGLGLPRDLERARDWYALAARLGDRHAEFALGEIALGEIALEGTPSDTETMQESAQLRADARGHFRRAAEAGHAAAAYNLALLVLDDEEAATAEEAVRWLQQAADAEIPAAQYLLAVLYRDGTGVDPDAARATALLHRAARNGHVPAMLEYGIAVFNGTGVAPDEARAATWLRRAAWHGDAIARNRLALLYAAGRGVEADRVEAAAWHLLAASQGLDDERLDAALRDLSQEERARAEALARDRAWP